jgi:hypothetical protein
MLALCPYCTQKRADLCIPEYKDQSKVLIVKVFRSADSQMSPFDID